MKTFFAIPILVTIGLFCTSCEESDAERKIRMVERQRKSDSTYAAGSVTFRRFRQSIQMIQRSDSTYAADSAKEFMIKRQQWIDSLCVDGLYYCAWCSGFHPVLQTWHEKK